MQVPIKKGTNVLGFIEAARKLGFEAKGVRVVVQKSYLFGINDIKICIKKKDCHF